MLQDLSFFHFHNEKARVFKMKTNQASIDFLDSKTLAEPFMQLENIIVDRGSKYSVSGGKVLNRDEIKAFLTQLKNHKKYAKATHHSWAARLSRDGRIWETKQDDGETGAGAVILRIMQKQNYVNSIVVVTRWFGGTHLGTDRFKHVQDATKLMLKSHW